MLTFFHGLFLASLVLQGVPAAGSAQHRNFDSFVITPAVPAYEAPIIGPISPDYFKSRSIETSA